MVKDFDEQIQAAQNRLLTLRERAGDGRQDEVMAQVFEELQTSLEELRVAEEELRQQNEEMAGARETLAMERQRYQELFEFAPDAYLVTDLAGTIREANQAAAQLLGIAPRFLPGKPLITFVAEENRHTFRSELPRLTAVDRLREWEIDVTPRGGETFTAAITVAVVRDRKGKPAALRWLVRDVTARKRAEKQHVQLAREQAARAEAEAAQRRLALLARAGALLSSSLDYEKTLQNVARLAVPEFADWCAVDMAEENGTIRRLAAAHGDPGKEELIRELRRRFGPDPEGSHPVLRVLRTGKSALVPEVTDAHLRSATRDAKHLEIVRALGITSYLCVPLIARGRTLGALSFIRAEPGRRYEPHDLLLAEELASRAALAVDNAGLYQEAQEANRIKDSSLRTLRESEERFRLLVEGATDYGMLLLDPEGRITGWSAGAQRILLYEESEVLGRPSAIIFTPEDREAGAPEQEMATAKATGRAEDQRWHVRKDGSRFWADGVLSALRDEGGRLRGFGKVLRDATERKQAQEALTKAFRREQRIARTLQTSLLPPIPEDAFPGLAVATLYQAALQEANVGGDFYDAFALTGGKVALVMGDASGKGLQAATRVAEVKYALRGFLREDPDPSCALTRVNDLVCDSKSLDDQTASDSFVVLSLVVLDLTSWDATFAAGGGEPPLILRAGGGTESVEAGGLLVGMFREQAYEAATLRLAPGDTLLLTTDGITEARSGATYLGYEGLVRLARQPGASAPVREIAQTVMDGARAFAGGALHDDACLLLARRR